MRWKNTNGDYFCRVKQLKEEPYTQKTAEAAVGLWTDNKGPQKKEAADVDMS